MPGWSAEDVRRTFIEFWPPALQALAPAQTGVTLTAAEYRIIRDGHRGVALDPAHAQLLAALSVRVALALPATGAFLRLGYGSWAGSQLDRFGTLRVADVARVRALLTLPDRRLGMIARRWVRGYTPMLFVRTWLADDLAAEIRVIDREARPWRAFLRHPSERGADASDLLPRLAASVDLAEAGASLPKHGLWSLDFAPGHGRWWLLDCNPFAAKPQSGTRRL